MSEEPQHGKVSELSRNNLMALSPKKYFSKFKSPIVSMDWSHDGKKLAATTESNLINIYDVEAADTSMMIKSDKYGAGQILWSAHPGVLIVSSTRGDHNIRCLSLHDNKYVQVLSGHTDKVNQISLSPRRDQLLTSSDDRTVLLWDLRDNRITHRLKTESSIPVAAIDPQGLVAALGFDSNVIKLYDFRNMTTGPFETFSIADKLDAKYTWSKFCFSPEGTYILINTRTPTTLLVDAFSGAFAHELNKDKTQIIGNFNSYFSSDEKYIFTGGQHGTVSIFETSSANYPTKIGELKSKHQGTVYHASMNPIYRVLATTSDEMHWWN